jgi:hypothetical protein
MESWYGFTLNLLLCQVEAENLLIKGSSVFPFLRSAFVSFAPFSVLFGLTCIELFMPQED